MEDPAERRKRLQAMKAATEKIAVEETTEASQTAVKFRNYAPRDPSLRGTKQEDLPTSENIEGEREVAVVPRREEEEEDVLKRELLRLQAEEVNIIPRHPNWDLKQGIQAKVDKLRRKTQKAIVEILREKLAEAQGENE